MEKLSLETKKIMIERFAKDNIIALATLENGMPCVRNESGMTLVPYKQKGLTFSTGATSFTWGVTVYSNVVSYK